MPIYKSYGKTYNSVGNQKNDLRPLKACNERFSTTVRRCNSKVQWTQLAEKLKGKPHSFPVPTDLGHGCITNYSPHQNSSKHEKSSILHGSTMGVNMTPYLKVEFTVLVRVAAGIQLINQKKKWLQYGLQLFRSYNNESQRCWDHCWKILQHEPHVRVENGNHCNVELSSKVPSYTSKKETPQAYLEQRKTLKVFIHTHNSNPHPTICNNKNNLFIT